LRQTAIDLGVKLLACKMSMDVMEITKDNLIDEVEDIVGVATYMKHAAESQVTLFI
jgi:peroxiredoxin family protein